MNRIIFDIKARSSVSIKDCGEAAFAQHPDTEIVCITLKEPYMDPVYWLPQPFRPRGYEGLSDDALSRLLLSNQLSAFNVETEMYLWKYALPKWLPQIEFPGPRYFDDIASRAVRFGLPANLPKLCELLSLKLLHEPRGKAYMHALLKNDRKVSEISWRNLKALLKHSTQTLLMEEAIAHALPDLSYDDQQAWILNWKINDRGIYVPREEFSLKLDQIRQEYDACRHEFADVVGQRPAENYEALHAYFRDHGVRLYGFSEMELQNAILHHPCGIVREALELKKRLVKHNIPEYEFMQNAICFDNRIRGIHKFFNSFTGNWSDRGSSIDKLKLVSASPGKTLIRYSFSQLDLRIADWLTGENLFSQGEYPSVFDEKAMPKVIGRVEELDSTRWMVEEMCQYEAPYRKFSFVPLLSGAFDYDGAISAMIENWKVRHPLTVNFRNRVQTEAKNLLNANEYEILIGKIRMIIMGKSLNVTLPSGRVLYYNHPRLKCDESGKKDSLIVNGIISRGWKEREMFGGCFLKDFVTALRHDFLIAYAMQFENSGGKVVRISRDSIAVEFDCLPEEDKLQTAYFPEWANNLPIQVQINK